MNRGSTHIVVANGSKEKKSFELRYEAEREKERVKTLKIEKKIVNQLVVTLIKCSSVPILTNRCARNQLRNATHRKTKT